MKLLIKLYNKLYFYTILFCFHLSNSQEFLSELLHRCRTKESFSIYKNSRQSRDHRLRRSLLTQLVGKKYTQPYLILKNYPIARSIIRNVFVLQTPRSHIFVLLAHFLLHNILHIFKEITMPFFYVFENKDQYLYICEKMEESRLPVQDRKNQSLEMALSLRDHEEDFARR